jgi:hypothetical protein
VNSRITLAIFMALGTFMTFSINPLQQQIQQNAFDFGARCEKCETINTIILENGELKKQG